MILLTINSDLFSSIFVLVITLAFAYKGYRNISNKDTNIPFKDECKKTELDEKLKHVNDMYENRNLN